MAREVGVFDENAQRFNLAPFCVTCTHGVQAVAATKTSVEYHKHTHGTADHTADVRQVVDVAATDDLAHYMVSTKAQLSPNGSRC